MTDTTSCLIVASVAVFSFVGFLLYLWDTRAVPALPAPPPAPDAPALEGAVIPVPITGRAAVALRVLRRYHAGVSDEALIRAALLTTAAAHLGDCPTRRRVSV